MTQQQNEKTSEKKTPALIAYHAPERENAPWTRIGAAWDHKDGEGFTLQLDLVPAATGRIVMRKFEPKPVKNEGEEQPQGTFPPTPQP